MKCQILHQAWIYFIRTTMKHRKIIKHFLHYNQHFSIRKSGFGHEEEELEDFAGDNHDEGHED